MKSEKGQSLVEFALILPLLILLLFGIVDFGRAFHVYLTLDHAGREVARVMSIGGNEGDINNKIASTTGSLDNKENQLTIDFHGKKTGLASGDEAKVTLTYQFKFITPVIEPWITWVKGKGTIPLKDTTVMRVE